MPPNTIAERVTSFARRAIAIALGALTALLSLSCDDETPRIDPPLSDLSVTWHEGFIEGIFFLPTPPDPIRCYSWLILENVSARQAFAQLEVPAADDILVAGDSTLGTIPLLTDWNGVLASGERDTVLFFKEMGWQVPIFDPPCDEGAFIDFMIRNADGETKVFRPDALTLTCSH